MTKKLKKKFHSPHLLVVLSLVVICGSLLGLSAQAHPVAVVHPKVKTHKAGVNTTISHHLSAPVTSKAPVVPTPVPTPPAAQAKPAAPVVPTPKVTSSSRPEPVVTPSPNSSVSALAPAGPSSPPASSGGSGSSSGSSPPTTTSYTSTNWSGYMSNSGTFTAISGSWAATNPSGNGTSTSADGTWIGIGGVTSGDLIQTGTQNIVSASGQVSSSAFYELLPNVSQTVPGMTVAPGDNMNASIDEVTSGQWQINISDTTRNESYSITVSYTSSHSSAEWIEEDPSYSSNRQIPFDSFHSATFSSGLTTVNGASQNIFGSNGQPITMVNRSGQTIASPSALTSDGAGFSVTP